VSEGAREGGEVSSVFRALGRYVAAPRSTDGPPTDDAALPPIGDETWAAWARQASAAEEPGTVLPSEETEVLWLAHALTKYPCRMADGRLGQVAMLPIDGEWTAVCRVP
jgi:hypothetical protein